MANKQREEGAVGGRQLGRRGVLNTALTLGPLTFSTRPASAAPAPQRGPLIVVGHGNAVVETLYGKVRGYTDDGIHTFKGIPYGESTGGQARFQPPVKPKPWTAVRDSLQYGSICPWIERGFADVSAFFWEHDFGRMREDCLNLNIWTPAVNDGRKRPVLFWLHGGGLIMGSSRELKAYDGTSLARRGDVVVVSINHRLNGFGFLNLSEFGERYSSSSHAGMLDIIAALEWVRDNIAGFGGDPGNVTVFGWSGGGAKVNYLMGMPAAQGLFHKAVAQSPFPQITKPLTVAQSLMVTARTLETLGLDRSSIGKINDVPTSDLVRAMARGVRGGSGGLDFGPVADGKILPANPFHPEAPTVSARVPLMIGTTMRESGPCLMCTDVMSAAELHKLVSDKHGDRADGIIGAFRAVYPEDEPFDLWSHINFFEQREVVLLEAERKATLTAPVYLYLFAWRTPMFEGRPRAFHGSELAFVFDNVDRCVRMTGGTDDARALASRVSGAWISFARSGTPSHSGLPIWPAVTADSRPTMVFDNRCEVKVDHDRPARQALASA